MGLWAVLPRRFRIARQLVDAWSANTIGAVNAPNNHWEIPASAASESDRCLRR
jgi:hypothetical protein